MSYADPDRRIYSSGIIDFGAGGEVLAIKGPKGKTGTLKWIHVSASETFTTTTTDGMVLLGTSGDTNAYAQFELGALADTDGASTDDGTTDTNAILDATIPADTQIEWSMIAPTGGTPAGIGVVTVCIDWAW